MAEGSGSGPGQDPGGTRKVSSWAQVLGSTLPTRLNRNVLEIVLDKDAKGAFNVSDHDCFRVLKKIGLDPIPGEQVEGVQICPNGRGVILVTLKDGVALDRFCRYDVFEVTNSGIRAVNVKPAGKREVVVTVRGLHPNTTDQGVLEYLNKFGRVVTTKVVYATFAEGPLKGIKNGDRSFKVELKADNNIGSYHVIDGNKVTIRYPGQKQTCARCHEVSTYCPGGGIAKKCEAAGGTKVELADHIVALWKKIGYEPGELEFAAVYDDHGDDLDQVAVPSPKLVTEFTPNKVVSEPEKFAGVTVKQFPKSVDTGDIIEFLVRSGLPETSKESVSVKANGHVTISNIENEVCLTLIEKIHNKKYLERKLYCNGIIPLTPEKQASPTPTQAPPSSSSPSLRCPPDQDSGYPALPVSLISEQTSSPILIGSSSTSTSFAQSLTEPNLAFEPTESNQEFVRRHSLSLRTPPPGSLASDILGSSSMLKAQTLIEEVRSMSEQLTDFGSCYSSSFSSEDEEKNQKEQKKKRKASKSPTEKSNFLKKKSSRESSDSKTKSAKSESK